MFSTLVPSFLAAIITEHEDKKNAAPKKRIPKKAAGKHIFIVLKFTKLVKTFMINSSIKLKAEIIWFFSD
jgi:hypothetical protein